MPDHSASAPAWRDDPKVQQERRAIFDRIAMAVMERGYPNGTTGVLSDLDAYAEAVASAALAQPTPRPETWDAAVPLSQKERDGFMELSEVEFIGISIPKYVRLLAHRYENTLRQLEAKSAPLAQPGAGSTGGAPTDELRRVAQEAMREIEGIRVYCNTKYPHYDLQRSPIGSAAEQSHLYMAGVLRVTENLRKVLAASRVPSESPDTEAYTTEYVTSLHGNPTWEAIWSVIRRWDISRTSNGLYTGATGDDATRIYDAIRAARAVSVAASSGSTGAPLDQPTPKAKP